MVWMQEKGNSYSVDSNESSTAEWRLLKKIKIQIYHGAGVWSDG